MKNLIVLIILLFNINIFCSAQDTIFSANKKFALCYLSNEETEGCFKILESNNKGKYSLKNSYFLTSDHKFIYNNEVENYQFFITDDCRYIVVQLNTKINYEGEILYWIIYKIDQNGITCLRTQRRRYSLKLTDFICLIPKDYDLFIKEYKNKYFYNNAKNRQFYVAHKLINSSLYIKYRCFDSLEDGYVERELQIPFAKLDM